MYMYTVFSYVWPLPCCIGYGRKPFQYRLNEVAIVTPCLKNNIVGVCVLTCHLRQKQYMSLVLYCVSLTIFFVSIMCLKRMFNSFTATSDIPLHNYNVKKEVTEKW